MTEALHDNPALHPHLPPRREPPGMDVPDDPAWRTCWEYVLTHELTETEGSAFWHGAELAAKAAETAALAGVEWQYGVAHDLDDVVRELPSLESAERIAAGGEPGDHRRVMRRPIGAWEPLAATEDQP